MLNGNEFVDALIDACVCVCVCLLDCGDVFSLLLYDSNISEACAVFSFRESTLCGMH
jgi:hypothetical protein